MRADRSIGAVTALVVGAVTALAFAQSFHALRGFAEVQQVVPTGWGWMFAATIDGFVLAALLTSLSLSLQGDRGAAPWAVRVLAVTAAAHHAPSRPPASTRPAEMKASRSSGSMRTWRPSLV